MHKFPKFSGMVTVGARGQVVIPKGVRKLLNIQSGDKLVVISASPSEKKVVSLIPADDFTRFLSHFEGHIATLKSEISKKGKL